MQKGNVERGKKRNRSLSKQCPDSTSNEMFRPCHEFNYSIILTCLICPVQVFVCDITSI